MNVNRNNKQLIKRFNTRDSVVVVTSYPDQGGESAVQNAVANYSRELLREMAKTQRVVVIAEVLDKPEMYIEDDILVVRAWRKNSKSLVKEMVKSVAQFSRIQNILVQFEFNIFGSPAITASTALAFGVMRLSGKRITFMFHQVVEDLHELSGHLGLSTGSSIKTTIFNWGMHWFYRLIGLTSETVLVHSHMLAKRLEAYMSSEKISVIPHGVSKPEKRLSQRQARKKLGLPVTHKIILLFGYVTWYKGTDWLMKKIIRIAQHNPQMRIRLVVAGGMSATLKDRPHYQKYMASLMWLAQQYPQLITITGYVPDSKKHEYFDAADVVVFPYRTAMSESGSMAHAYAYHKPLLLSYERIESVMDDSMQTLMQKLHLQPEDIAFYLRNGSFEKKLLRLLRSKKLQLQLMSLSRIISRERNWRNVSTLYLEAMKKASSHAYLSQIISPSYLLKPRKALQPAYAWARSLFS